MPECTTTGVRHTQEADIQAIRDILTGYNDEASILKELIQNAEDAGATSMRLHYTDAQESPFEGVPSLLVANDGEFRRQHLEAIPQLNLGTKGTDDRAIGRFGKGLKSAFAWCEEFFYVAQTDQNMCRLDDQNTREWSPEQAQLVCRFRLRGDDDMDIAALFERTQSLLAGWNERPWLAFWFPLRCDTQNVVQYDWIHRRFPGDDNQFPNSLCGALQQLAPSLAMLRHLRKITICDGVDVLAEWEFKKGRRVPGPDGMHCISRAAGSMALAHAHAGNPSALHYCGTSGCLSDEHAETIATIKAMPRWPRVSNQPVAGAPHCATLLSAADAVTERGSFSIRWCVFFPIGAQPPDEHLNYQLPGLPWDITLNLHGFFFLDSERLRIDGLEEAFRGNGQAQNPVCVEWNRLLAHEGVLPQIPAALDMFARVRQLKAEQCRTLAEAMKGTWLWQTFHEQICSQWRWVPRWQPTGAMWELAAGQTFWIPDRVPADLLAEAFPALSDISAEKVLVPGGEEAAAGLTAGDKSQHLPESDVMALLERTDIDGGEHQSAIDWLNDLLDDLHGRDGMTEQVREAAWSLRLLPVRNGRSDEAQRISASDWAKRPVFATRINLLDHLLTAAPAWQCWIAEHVHPWAGRQPSACDAAKVAEVIFGQTSLAGFPARLVLVQSLLPNAPVNPCVRRAVRYLIHASYGHRNDGDTKLFMPQQEDIWSRLIRQLLGAEAVWRIVPHEWHAELNDHQRDMLGIGNTDAGTTWVELHRRQAMLPTLHFPEAYWSDDEICGILAGLYSAMPGRHDDTAAMLRALPIHRKRGNRQRVSVASPEGGLRAGVVLDSPEVGDGLPAEPRQLWVRLLNEVEVIEQVPANAPGAVVQRSIFGQTQLGWNYVVRHCISSDNPGNWAPLIMEALATGDAAVRGIGDEFKRCSWIPLGNGAVAPPGSVLLIQGMAEDALDMLRFERDRIVGEHALPNRIRGHNGFRTLRNYLAKDQFALPLLARWLQGSPDWHLGLCEAALPQDRQALLGSIARFEGAPGPGAQLLQSLHAAAGNGPITADMLRATIWPAVLQPFQEEADVPRIQRILLQLCEDGQRGNVNARTAFDAYLKQTVADDLVPRILPALRLMNQTGQWSPASELIWPAEGIVPSVQVCNDHARILRLNHRRQPGVDAHVQQGDEPLAFAFNEKPDFPAAAHTLRAYLQPFRDGQVGPMLPAALVAVLGRQPDMIALLRELLGDRQNCAEFLQNLLGGADERVGNSINNSRFLVEIVEGQATLATTLTGGEINVNLSQEVTSLIVGDPNNLWWRHRYQNRPDTECCCLRLRAVPDPNVLVDPIAVFHATIETIIRIAHCNDCPQYLPGDLRGWLTAIADAGQADLRRSQLHLLDMVETRISELGLRTDAHFREIVRAYDALRQRRVDREMNRARNPGLDQLLEEAQRNLDEKNVEFENHLNAVGEDDLRAVLVAALRRKMTDYQYDMRSVLLELFQNADDATVESDAMPGDRQAAFTLSVVDRCWTVTHWGRRINEYTDQAGRERGYDQDLNKMLSLNFSDKGRDEATARVTGRFGLGFKTVFFVTDEPQVASGRLAFSIRGGFYPVALDCAQTETLRGTVPGVQVRDFPTVIRMPWRADDAIHQELDGALADFRRIAPYLSVFSRRLRRVVVGNDTLICDESQMGEAKHVRIVRVAGATFLRLLCPLGDDADPASMLIRVAANGHGLQSLDADVPRVWVTTPMEEPCETGWALNAPFKPDAGRKRLALGNPANRALAEQVAARLGDALIDLFDVTDNWEDVTRRLGITCSRDEFWLSLWRLMTHERHPPLEWDALHSGGQALSWIMWGRNVGAMRRLIQEREAVPSGLPGEYGGFAKASDIQFRISGALGSNAGKNDCFAVVARWASMSERYPPGQTVASDVGEFLIEARLVTGDLRTVHLIEVLSGELGADHTASPDAADRIGELWHALKDRAHSEEAQTLHGELLSKACFMAQNGEYRISQELIAPRVLADMISVDEARRAAFAPESEILSSDYSDKALTFFATARSKLAADTERMACWARAAAGDKLTAVFEYINRGDLDQEVADELGQDWFEEHTGCQELLGLDPEKQNEIRRKFARGRIMEPVGGGVVIGQRPVVIVVPEPWTVGDLWRWWQSVQMPTADYVLEGDANWPLWAIQGNGEREEHLRIYLRAPGTDAGKALWYRLFGYACLMAAGRRTGELRDFWTVRLGAFWKRTSSPDDFSTTTVELFQQAVEAEFDDLNARGEDAHYWRRVFYDIRKVHRMVWQNDFPSSLMALANQGHCDGLAHFLRTGELLGQPNWSGTFGQSAGAPLLFIIRELVRLGIIPNDAACHAFFVCTPVRRAMRWIGWLERDEASGWTFQQLVDLSEELHNRIAAEEEVRQQLLGYYDIPLLHMGLTENGPPPGPKA